MAGAFVSGATAADGASYLLGSGSDLLLCWMATGYKFGTTTTSLQTYNAVSMNERVDQTIDLAGGADPVGMLADLAGPATGTNTIDLTWSSALSNETGYAMTLSGIDQTTPLASTNQATYTTATAPSFTINAVAGDVIVYFRHHCSATVATWTPPSGFTERFTNTLITSPASRQVKVYTRDVTSTLTSHSLSATTTGTSVGGVHGYAIYSEAAAAGGGIQVLRRRIEGH